jgi:drug/metabolite transporter (DMT)-like permease
MSGEQKRLCPYTTATAQRFISIATDITTSSCLWFKLTLGLEKSFGALVTLGATFLYACVYVLSDKVLSTFKPKPIPEKVCSMVGGYASLLTFVYLCVYTFPKWQTEVLDVVHAHQGSWVGIILVYPLVTISSMLHSLNYYVLISRINSVAVGIMQSLRAVLVFVMSHYLFCSVSTTQCFNEWKFVSAIVVIGCVTLFSISSAPAAPESKESIELHATGSAAKGRAPAG